MKYSIITATYNAEKFIDRCFLSIFSQTYPNLEWIVQDGGSKDNTLAILDKYKDARIKIQSEPDSGIYNAWNKGIKRATGDWAIFLGADDYFLDKDVLIKCHRHIKRVEKSILFAYGALVKVRGTEITQVRNYTLTRAYQLAFYTTPTPVPATFMRMNLLKQYPFDEKYKIAADYDYLIRFITGDNIYRIPVMAVAAEDTGISSGSSPYFCDMLEETQRIIHERTAPRVQELMQASFENYWNRASHLE